jgi:hypothetical protein
MMQIAENGDPTECMKVGTNYPDLAYHFIPFANF